MASAGEDGAVWGLAEGAAGFKVEDLLAVPKESRHLREVGVVRRNPAREDPRHHHQLSHVCVVVSELDQVLSELSFVETNDIVVVQSDSADVGSWHDDVCTPAPLLSVRVDHLHREAGVEGELDEGNPLSSLLLRLHNPQQRLRLSAQHTSRDDNDRHPFLSSRNNCTGMNFLFPFIPSELLFHIKLFP